MVARRGSPAAFPMKFVSFISLVSLVSLVSMPEPMHNKGSSIPTHRATIKAHPSTLPRPRPYGILDSGVG